MSTTRYVNIDTLVRDITLELGPLDSLLHQPVTCAILKKENEAFFTTLKDLSARGKALDNLRANPKTKNAEKTLEIAAELLKDTKILMAKSKEQLKKEMPYQIRDFNSPAIALILRKQQEIKVQQDDFSKSDLPFRTKPEYEMALGDETIAYCQEAIESLETLYQKFIQASIYKTNSDAKSENDYVNKLENLVEIAEQTVHLVNYRKAHANVETECKKIQDNLYHNLCNAFRSEITNINTTSVPSGLKEKLLRIDNHINNFKEFRFNQQMISNLGLQLKNIVKLNLAIKDLPQLNLTKDHIARLNLSPTEIAKLILSEKEQTDLKLTASHIEHYVTVIHQAKTELGLPESAIESLSFSPQEMEKLKLSERHLKNLKLTKENIPRLKITDEDIEHIKNSTLTKTNITILKLEENVNNFLNLKNLGDLLRTKKNKFLQECGGSEINRNSNDLALLRKKVQSYREMNNCLVMYIDAFQLAEQRRRTKSTPKSIVNTVLLMVNKEINRLKEDPNMTECSTYLSEFKKEIDAEVNLYTKLDEDNQFKDPYAAHRGRPLSPQTLDKEFSKRIMVIENKYFSPKNFNKIANDHKNTFSGWFLWFALQIHTAIKSMATCFCLGSGYAPTMFATKRANKIDEMLTEMKKLKYVTANPSPETSPLPRRG